MSSLGPGCTFGKPAPLRFASTSARVLTPNIYGPSILLFSNRGGKTVGGSTIQFLGIVAGFLMIAVASVLAFRQSMTWQHVLVFCLGGVLTGISGVQFQSQGMSVTIGQIASATNLASTASSQQAEAITTLSSRIDQLQDEISQVLVKTASGQAAATPVVPNAQALNAQRIKLNLLLAQSKFNSSRALAISRQFLPPK